MSLVRLSANMLFLFCLLWVTTAFAEDDVRATPRAKQHFAAGLAHVDDPSGPNYEDAYREFHIAYADSPARDIAVNIGTCALYLERDAEAIEMYELFLAKAKDKDITPRKREQMEKDIQSLRAGLVRLSIKATPSSGLLVDQRFTSKGTIVVNRYPVSDGVAALGIHPGNHKLTLEAEGYEPQTWGFDAPPASHQAHEFTLVSTAAAKQANSRVVPGPAPRAGAAGANTSPPKDVTAPRETDSKRTSPMVYVGAVATGVFAVGAAGTGLLATSKRSDYNAVNDGTKIDAARELNDDTKRYLLVSDVLFGAALASAGIATYFYFAGSRSAPPTLTAKAKWNVASTAGRSGATIALIGVF